MIHRIGLPENDSETKAIKRLGKKLPDDYFVFHNFEVTTGRGLPYEYDIAVLSPHALYHLEVNAAAGRWRPAHFPRSANQFLGWPVAAS
jgi:hypothetical protein